MIIVQSFRQLGGKVNKFVAFDIEISKEIPEGTDDWKSLRPLGISCAATLTDDGGLRLWHGDEGADGRLSPRLAPERCETLVEYLIGYAEGGAKILTWNGLGFDFDILQEECGLDYTRTLCHLLAYHDHIDMMFQLFCECGFCLGLDAAAKGMGLPGKVGGMHGDLAPVMWARDRASQNRVLEYVAQDVRTTADLYRAICKHKGLTWTAKSGKPAFWRPTFRIAGDVNNVQRMLTVEECLRLPEPDVSWMKDPWPRSKFSGWLRLPGVDMGAPMDPAEVQV